MRAKSGSQPGLQARNRKVRKGSVKMPPPPKMYIYQGKILPCAYLANISFLEGKGKFEHTDAGKQGRVAGVSAHM